MVGRPLSEEASVRTALVLTMDKSHDLHLHGNLSCKYGGKLEGYLVADGALGSEGGVEVSLRRPQRPRVFLIQEEHVVAMLANGVATLTWHHGADNLVEAVHGRIVEDALVLHHAHHVGPRPVFLS